MPKPPLFANVIRSAISRIHANSSIQKFSKLAVTVTLASFTFTPASAQLWGNGDTRTETRNDAGASGSTVRSGFYETSSPVNFPSGASGWWHLLDTRHSTGSNNYAMQFSGSFFDQNLYFRKTANSASQPWSRVITEYENAAVVAERLLLHSPFAQSANWTRGITGSNVKWNFTADKWNIGFQEPGDFGMTRYENGGAISFFNGSFSAQANKTNAEMESYRRMTIANNGNVGIGTATPSAMLDVKGAAFLDAENSGLVVDAGGLKRVGFLKYAGREAGIWRATDVNFEIGRTNVITLPGNPSSFTTDLFISSNGNIGVGTNNPVTKLAVNGNIQARKVKVTVSPSDWPDYVFAPEYHLLPLDELAAYIKNNRHLPDIISAAEVEEQGLDLGDNQGALLKKIEELTLYLIQQSKLDKAKDQKLEQLEKKFEEQQKEIDTLKKLIQVNVPVK